MVKDFTQKYGVDYENIFAPDAHLSFVCPLVVFVASLVFFYQMDVKKCIFNSAMNEEACMQLGMVMERGELESSPPPRLVLSCLIPAPPSMTRKTSSPHPYPAP